MEDECRIMEDDSCNDHASAVSGDTSFYPGPTGRWPSPSRAVVCFLMPAAVLLIVGIGIVTYGGFVFDPYSFYTFFGPPIMCFSMLLFQCSLEQYEEERNTALTGGGPAVKLKSPGLAAACPVTFAMIYLIAGVSILVFGIAPDGSGVRGVGAFGVGAFVLPPTLLCCSCFSGLRACSSYRHRQEEIQSARQRRPAELETLAVQNLQPCLATGAAPNQQPYPAPGAGAAPNPESYQAPVAAAAPNPTGPNTTLPSLPSTRDGPPPYRPPATLPAYPTTVPAGYPPAGQLPSPLQETPPPPYIAAPPTGTFDLPPPPTYEEATKEEKN